MNDERRSSEDLSRLLAGELTLAEEAALRARLAEEPALARAWERMQALPGDLAGLPEVVPPADLNDRVLAGTDEPPQRWSASPTVMAVLAAAAALLVLVLWPGGSPQLVLTDGEQWVEGQATVLAAGVPVEVDGVARIRVEPSQGALRERGQEVVSMDWKHAAAVVAGAAITVTVYEGSAIIGGEDGGTIEAGETWHKTEATERPEPGRRVVTRTGGPDVADEDDPEVLRARIDALEHALATADFEDAIQRGRIAAVEGRPQEWPADLPPQLQASGFEQSLRDGLADNEDLEILEVNCDEYPCYAIIEADPETMGPGRKPGGGAIQAWAETVDGDVGLMNMVSVLGGPDGEVGLMGVSLIAEGQPSDEVSTRLNYRMEGSVKGWVEDIMGEDEGYGEDVEIEG